MYRGQPMAAAVAAVVLLILMTPPSNGAPRFRRQAQPCEKLDVMFAVDSTKAVGGENWVKMRNFIKNTADQFSVGSDRVRLGMISFADNTRVDAQLKDTSTAANFQTKVDGAGHMNKDTRMMARAIQMSIAYLDQSLGGRDGVSDVVIIVTSGKATDSSTLSLYADLLQKKGATVFAVGVGGNVDVGQLNVLGSDPDSQTVFQVNSYDQLDGLKSNIKNAVCGVAGQDECASNPCLNGGKCVDGDKKYTCICASGYIGNDCELECGPMDLALLLDESGSIGSTNWQKVREFSTKLVEPFDIGQSKTRVSLAKFSTNSQVEFNFNEYNDKSSLVSRLSKLSYLGGYTNTQAGLKTVREQLYQAVNGDRSSVPNVAVVFTDGESNKFTSETIPQAQELQKASKRVICVAVGSNLNQKEIEAIASDPDSENLIVLKDFSQLNSVIARIAQGVCKQSVNNPCDSKPCENGGQCQPSKDLKSYTCQCAKGFLGATCAIVDYCASAPCKNGGVCTNGQTTYNCACTAGFSGTNCAQGQQPSGPCSTTQLDLCFIVDASASILPANWPKVLRFVSDVANGLTLGSNNAQVGVVTFSSTVELSIRQNQFRDKTGLQNAINSIFYMQRGTNTGLGLEKARTDCFSGATGDRSNVKNTAILVTDGKSSDAASTKTQAAQLRTVADVLAIGFGSFDRVELNEITADANKVYAASSADALNNIVQNILNGACGNALPPSPCNPNPCQNGGQCTVNGGSFTCQCAQGFSGTTCSSGGQTGPCSTTLLDLCFIVDASASILPANWPKVLRFVSDVANGLTLGSNNAQVGVVTFSSTVELSIRQNQFRDKTGLQNAINSIFYMQRGTNTGLGLEKARTDCFSGATGDRSNVKNTAILVTDGKSSDAASTKTQAAQLRNIADVLAIGFGSFDRVELNEITADANKVYAASSADALDSVVQSILSGACGGNGNACLSNPCRNGGVCQQSGAGYTCTCGNGFTGTNCQNPVQTGPCNPDPCQNGGQCFSSGTNYFCQCKTGYSGQNCQDSACNPNPCQNGGNCFLNGGSYVCQCAQGFSGQNCQDGGQTNQCSPNPCQNGGQCIINGGSYTCQCKQGYSGQNCQNTPCNPNPCQNGGQCSQNGGSYTCQCANGFIGLNCQTHPCSPSPCQNGAQCFASGTNFFCQCQQGYSGQYCQNSQCNPNPCQNGGQCLLSGGSYICQCPQGFSGQNCQTSPCNPNPCLNGGQCAINGGSYVCQCNQGYSGQNCQTGGQTNPCYPNPCQNGGQCAINGGTYSCQCKQGYGGQNCQNTPCNPNPCQNGGQCSQNGGSYTCQCANGFIGLTCQTHPCNPSPCQNGAQCFASGTNFFCQCQQGYSGQYCQSSQCNPNPCQNGGQCTLSGAGYVCQCPQGFTGQQCQTSPCNPNPCQNGGQCAINSGSYVCNCPQGYTGQNCQTNPCNPNPCQNGGQCTNNGGSYTCQCAQGWSGQNCQDTPCNPNPCQNGGQCVINGGGYTCQCKQGFSGQNCQNTPCNPNPCQNGGQCTQNGGIYTCQCANGFIGLNCQTHPCNPSPCQNGAQCFASGTNFFCQCQQGYSGQYCQNSQCNPNPCQNGGQCILSGAGYVCQCAQGFTGQNCQTSPCNPNPCQNGGQCAINGGSYVCNCPQGYTGTNCQTRVQTDPCNPNPCQNGGQCTANGGIYTCQCAQGWSGQNCQTKQTDPCNPNPCQNGGQCFSSGTNYFCQCKTGYSGQNCQDSPCNPNPCQNGGQCSQNGGSYTCQCAQGWSGQNCQTTQTSPCNPNPCQNGGQCFSSGTNYFCQCTTGYSGQNCQNSPCNPNPCQNGGQCSINGGSYTCTCAQGWSGDNCQTNPCNPNPCQNGGQCTNNGGSYTCQCAQGWSGQNCQTQQTSPCSPNPCMNGGNCFSSGTNYVCQCASGYSGQTCQNSACNPNPCQNNGACTLQGDSYQCQCTQGYTGQNCQTGPAGCDSNPCKNGGKCANTQGGYTCTCVNGFSGTNCQTAPACVSNPCQNGGQCTNANGGYTCTCANGFSGTNCQTATNKPCDSSPCKNGGQCTNTNTGYTCQCVNGYTGNNCQTAPPCASSPCKNGGTCTNGNNIYTCKCKQGFVGTNCEIQCDPIDLAFLLDQSGSIGDANWPKVIDFAEKVVGSFEIGDTKTRVGVARFASNAAVDFHMNKYKTRTDVLNQIKGLVYQPGGTNTQAGLKLVREQMFTNGNGDRDGSNGSPNYPNIAIVFTDGKSNISPEQTIPQAQDLQNAGVTVICVAVGSAQSLDEAELKAIASDPDSEYLVQRTSFDDLDAVITIISDAVCSAAKTTPCSSSPCKNGGQCTNTNTGYTCKCVNGYTGSNCQTAPPCASSPCKNGGTCTNGNNIYTCKCKQGFVGTNCEIQCDPIDLAFLLDQSGSIGDANWPKVIDFAEKVVGSFEIGDTKTRVGVARFASNAAVDFHMNKYITRTDVLNQIKGLVYQPGGTNTQAGLKLVREQMFTNGNGDRDGSNGSPNYPNIAIVFTDGKSNVSPEQTIPQAQDLQNAGVTVICVAVGSAQSLDEAELKAIASDPDSEYLVQRTSFDDLDAVITIISDAVCSAAKPVPCDSNPCKNGGKCTNANSDYTCSCVNGYTGKNCQTAPDPCASNPCKNGATCNAQGTTGYTCKCTAKYAGTHCSYDAPETVTCVVCSSNVQGSLCGKDPVDPIIPVELGWTIKTCTQGCYTSYNPNTKVVKRGCVDDVSGLPNNLPKPIPKNSVCIPEPAPEELCYCREAKQTQGGLDNHCNMNSFSSMGGENNFQADQTTCNCPYPKACSPNPFKCASKNGLFQSCDCYKCSCNPVDLY